MKNSCKHQIVGLILILGLLGVSGCGLSVKYTTSGASTDGMNSCRVAYFQNLADIVNPSLSQEITEMLKDKIISQTSLELVDGPSDAIFEGEIIGYTTDPAAITGNETAALNRFTITIKVKYSNLIDSTQDFETTFKHFSEYDSQSSLDAVEGELVPEILEKIIDDIFNRAFVNW